MVQWFFLCSKLAWLANKNMAEKKQEKRPQCQNYRTAKLKDQLQVR